VAAGALACAAAASCTVGPNYHAPDLRIERSYGPSAQAEQNAAWWTALNDPTLESLIAAAAGSNLDLKLAEARIREARAQRAVVFGGTLPTANVSGEFQHDRFSQNAAPFNAFDVPNFPWEYNLYQLGFDASWEIDVFGGTRRSVEAANATVEAGEEGRRAVLVSLLGEVARNYVELRGYQDRHQIALNNLALQRETVELTRNRMTNGTGTQLDVSRAEAEASLTAAQVPVFERLEAQALHRLVVLTNQPLDKLLYLRQAGRIPAVPASVMVGVPADLLRRRPDIRRAERQLAAATAQIGVAEAQLYPRFSLSGFFNLQSASIEDIFDWKSRAFSIGPTVTWPIFEAGRLQAVVDVRNAQQAQALAGYEQTVQNAIEEVRNGMVSFTTEQRRRESLGEAVKADKESLELARQLYGQGLIDFLTVLDAERQLNAAEDQLSQSEETVAASLIALYKALGGGWDAVIPAATQPATMPATAPATRAGPTTEGAASMPVRPDGSAAGDGPKERQP
jgi:NodT family efflux transporter outer membrane factor (OMF) lipoprotein